MKAPDLVQLSLRYNAISKKTRRYADDEETRTRILLKASNLAAVGRLSCCTLETEWKQKVFNLLGGAAVGFFTIRVVELN